MKLTPFKIGQHITLVSKGIRKPDYGDPYVETDKIGRTSYVKITRIGTTYIYGKYIHFSNGKPEECYWEAKINPKDYLILFGIRTDITQIYKKHQSELEEYEKRRKEAMYEIKRELYQIENEKRKNWEERNPRPAPIHLFSLRRKRNEKV